MSELDSQRPEWRSVPYQIKRTSVRDACRAMQIVRAFNAQLAQDKAAGCRLDEDFAELGFRSRKNPRQSCYIPMTRSLRLVFIARSWARSKCLNPFP